MSSQAAAGKPEMAGVDAARNARVIPFDEARTLHDGVAFNLEESAAASSEAARELAERVGEAPAEGFSRRPLYRAAKRAADVAFSLLFLVAFCWLFAIAIKVDDPKGPVIFKQERVCWAKVRGC